MEVIQTCILSNNQQGEMPLVPEGLPAVYKLEGQICIHPIKSNHVKEQGSRREKSPTFYFFISWYHIQNTGAQTHGNDRITQV